MDEVKFTCLIHDRIFSREFHAEVKVKRARPVESRDNGMGVPNYDVFVKPIVHNPNDIKDHMLVYDHTGDKCWICIRRWFHLKVGNKWVIRNERETACVIADYGVEFAHKVTAALAALRTPA
jgi:hypothetical protein